MSASFDKLAPYYDILMRDVPYSMWASYYHLLLLTHDLDPKSLLDVGCGTGTVAFAMAQAGFKVTGIDISPQMIESAIGRLSGGDKDPSFEVADATIMRLGQKFDSAYSFFDSLNYIATLDGFRSAIKCVGKHLDSPGSFVFDLNTEYSFLYSMFDQQDMRPRTKFKYRWKGDYDRYSRIIKVTMEFFPHDGEPFVETHTQRAHSPDEVEEALADAGFELFRVYDSYTLNAPKPTSDRVHYVAIK